MFDYVLCLALVDIGLTSSFILMFDCVLYSALVDPRTAVLSYSHVWLCALLSTGRYRTDVLPHSHVWLCALLSTV